MGNVSPGKGKGELLAFTNFLVRNKILGIWNWNWMAFAVFWQLTRDVVQVTGQLPPTCDRHHREFLEFYCPLTCPKGFCQTTPDGKNPVCFCLKENKPESSEKGDRDSYYQINCSGPYGLSNDTIISQTPGVLNAPDPEYAALCQLRKGSSIFMCVGEGRTPRGKTYRRKTFYACAD